MSKAKNDLTVVNITEVKPEREVLTKEAREQVRRQCCQLIREARKKACITCKQAAADFGLSESVMSRYEQGNTPMSMDMLIALTWYYQIGNVFQV